MASPRKVNQAMPDPLFRLLFLLILIAVGKRDLIRYDVGGGDDDG